MPRAKDRFYDYLEYCSENGPISVGDYIEKFAPREVLAWTKLVNDVMDTYKSGSLVKLTVNGGAAYVPPALADKYKKEGNSNGNVRQRGTA